MLFKFLGIFFSDTNQIEELLCHTPYGTIPYNTVPYKQYNTIPAIHLPYNVFTHVIHLFNLEIFMRESKREVCLHLKILTEDKEY